MAQQAQRGRAAAGHELDHDVRECIEREAGERRTEAGAGKIERDRAISLLQRGAERGKEMRAAAEPMQADEGGSLADLLDVHATAAENYVAATTLGTLQP